ncbi:MAG: metallophosphoesterase [Kiritimatiellae bacterium]|nr:metallophosphoesterase [Kiritimatiellia bacterium]
MKCNRRMFLSGLFASFLASRRGLAQEGASAEPKLFTRSPSDYDPNLVVLFSDTHCSPTKSHDQSRNLRSFIAEVLRLNPLPAQAVLFGDFAYHFGLPEDYRYAAQLVKPLTDAGVKLTIGMGNHDRREEFLEVFPDFAKSTKVPGRIVSIVETPHADLILLDSLQQGVDKNKWITPGELNEEQRAWLTETLRAYRKPVFVGAHHPVQELKIEKLLFDSPMAAGYIHGHNHQWKRLWMEQGWKYKRVFRTLGLPSTSHWGDIGYSLFRLSPQAATVTLRQIDFYYPKPVPTQERPADWDVHVAENNGQTCTFQLPQRAAVAASSEF